MGCPVINFRAKLCVPPFADAWPIVHKARAWLDRGTGYATLQHWVSGSRSRSIMFFGVLRWGEAFPLKAPDSVNECQDWHRTVGAGFAH